MYFTDRLSLRRRLFLGTTLAALTGAIGASAVSCAALPEVPSGVCGNFVVEPSNGEACDEPDLVVNSGADLDLGTSDAGSTSDTGNAGTIAAKKTRCGKSFEVGACRYVCDYNVTDGVQCPADRKCGLDGICRKADGLKSASITIGGGGTNRLAKGDFDGDGRSDLVAIADNTLDVNYFTSDGYIDRTLTLPNEQRFPGIGDLDKDGISDLVLHFKQSLGVLFGQDGRGFMPQTFPTIAVDAEIKQVVPLGAFLSDSAMLAFTKDPNGSTSVQSLLFKPDGGHTRELVYPQPGDPPIAGSITGSVGVTSINVGNPPVLDAVVAAEVQGTGGAASLVVIRCNAKLELCTPTPFLLPFKGAWGGVNFADIDADGDDDLVYGQRTGDTETVRVKLYDQATEAFIDPLPALSPLLTVEANTCIDGVLSSAPLAVADINGDGFADFIDNRGILYHRPDVSPMQKNHICHPNSMITWVSATVGDFNADGRSDLLAAREKEPVLDLWLATSAGSWNTLTIAVEFPVAELAGGDFDGDLVFDAAFRYGSGPNGMGAPGEISVLFGEPLGYPKSPVSLGFVPDPQLLVAGRIKGQNAISLPDPLSDLLIVSNDIQNPGRKFGTLLQGNFTRTLISPLSMKSTTEPIVDNMPGQLYGAFVSDFGSAACDQFWGMSLENQTPGNSASILVLDDGGQIWLGGCGTDGSSLPLLQEPLNFSAPMNPNEKVPVGFLSAPVERKSGSTSLALFLNAQDAADPPLGLAFIDYLGDRKFSPLPRPLIPINAGIRLPNSNDSEIPFAYEDLDDNGLPDLVLTGGDGTGPVQVFTFWNDADAQTPLNPDLAIPLEFDPIRRSNDFEQGSATNSIVDVAILNLDDDPYQELAILTRDYVYLAKLKVLVGTTEDGAVIVLRDQQTNLPVLVEPRKFELLNGGRPFTEVRGGQAMLGIDANSDGVDDLVVADPRKLLLFLGKERR